MYKQSASPALKTPIGIGPARHLPTGRRNLPSTNEPAISSPAASEAILLEVKSCHGIWLPSTETTSNADPSANSTQNMTTRIRRTAPFSVRPGTPYQLLHSLADLLPPVARKTDLRRNLLLLRLQQHLHYEVEGIHPESRVSIIKSLL